MQAALDQLPATITSHELSGTVENERIRRLADSLGWPATEVNFAYVLAAADAGALLSQDDGLRGVVPEDHGWIAPLHELEFPNTYFSAQQLIERAGTGAHVVLVATTADGHAAGYAAGRIQPDGIGYIDFVAVEPSVRGGGAGRRLVSGLARRLLGGPRRPRCTSRCRSTGRRPGRCTPPSGSTSTSVSSAIDPRPDDPSAAAVRDPVGSAAVAARAAARRA